MRELRTARADDFPSIREIYRQGIETKNATFETTAPEWPEWDGKFLKLPRIVSVDGARVTGWAALSQVSSRAAYAGVCEVSIYVHSDHQGRGIGRQLLGELIRQSEERGIWTLQAGIFPENTASIKLHKELGFREVGYRERIGQLDHRWRNTVLLERRSRVVGV